jgi:hypothetical protein
MSNRRQLLESAGKSPRSLGLGAALALVAAMLTLGVALAAAAPAPRTLPSVYTPFTDAGRPAGHVIRTVRGDCFTGSLSVAHADVWRCISANELYDPCFSSTKAAGTVLCPATGPWSTQLIEIRLTQALPHKDGNHGRPSTTALPWALETTAGWKCRLDTGATTAVQDEKLNYFCTGTRDGLWGSPSRRSEPWTIIYAPDTAKSLTRRIGITIAWF